MNKKFSYIIALIIMIAVIAAAIYYLNQNKAREEATTAERLSAEIEANEEAYRRENPSETEISSFSTPLLDKSSRKT